MTAFRKLVALTAALLCTAPAHADRLTSDVALSLDICLGDRADAREFKDSSGKIIGVVIRCTGPKAAQLYSDVREKRLGEFEFTNEYAAVRFGAPVPDYARCLTTVEHKLDVCAFFVPQISKAEADRLLLGNALYQEDLSDYFGLNEKFIQALNVDDDLPIE